MVVKWPYFFCCLVSSRWEAGQFDSICLGEDRGSNSSVCHFIIDLVFSSFSLVGFSIPCCFKFLLFWYPFLVFFFCFLLFFLFFSFSFLFFFCLCTGVFSFNFGSLWWSWKFSLDFPVIFDELAVEDEAFWICWCVTAHCQWLWLCESHHLLFSPFFSAHSSISFILCLMKMVLFEWDFQWVNVLVPIHPLSYCRCFLCVCGPLVPDHS